MSTNMSAHDAFFIVGLQTRHHARCKPIAAMALALLGSVGAAAGAQAAVVTWTGGKEGVWYDRKNWLNADPPMVKDHAVIGNQTVTHIDNGTGPTLVDEVSLGTGTLFVTSGRFAATKGINGTAPAPLEFTSGTLLIGKATVMDTKVAKLKEVSIRSGTALLDRMTFERIDRFTHESGATARVKNGLTFTRLGAGVLGGNFEFSGSQTLSGATFDVTGGSRLDLTEKAKLTLHNSTWTVAPGKRLTIGSRFDAPTDATTLTLTGFNDFQPTDRTSDVVSSTVIEANRIINESNLSFIGGRALNVTFKARSLRNEKFIQTGGKLTTFDTVTLTNNGELTLGGGKADIDTLELVNNGTLTFDALDGATVDALVKTENKGTLTVKKNRSVAFNSGYKQTKGSTTVDGLMTVAENGVKADAVFTGGTLGGSGTINGDVTSSIRVGPGNSPGELTIEGDYTQQDRGRLVVELAGTSFGGDATAYDRLTVIGETSLAGALDVALLDGFTPSEDDSFTILTSTGSLLGSFANTNAVDDLGRVRVGDGFFSVLYQRSDGLSSVVLSDFRLTPIPAPGLLAGAALLALGWTWRRRRAPGVA